MGSKNCVRGLSEKKELIFMASKRFNELSNPDIPQLGKWAESIVSVHSFVSFSSPFSLSLLLCP
jgi:hypothetical protein